MKHGVYDRVVFSFSRWTIVAFEQCFSSGRSGAGFHSTRSIHRPVHFAELLGKSVVVPFFYPKDYSAGCTAEACAFLDS